MAHLLILEHIRTTGKPDCDRKGNSFSIKRIFYIYGVDDSVRGKHRHKKTIQAAICIRGTCKIFNDDNVTQEEFVLDRPEKCLILEPKDWHKMYDFSNDAVLLVLLRNISTPMIISLNRTISEKPSQRSRE